MSDELWDKCVSFHGHACAGLAIGYRASRYAAGLLGLDFSSDEVTACICENDACGVDAVQAVLGCSVGKGNLLFKLRGKQAFTFFNRKNGRSARLVLKPLDIPKDVRLEKMLSLPDSELFDVKPSKAELPEKARIFASYPCAKCGETTAENMIRLQNGNFYCLDCLKPYSRFSL